MRDLRLGVFDVLVGINLLREGLDIPECALVGILDADKEGFLRSETYLIQTIGRAARNLDGKVILYADKETKSIKKAIKETERRRNIQLEYNKKNKISASTVKKEISDVSDLKNPSLSASNIPTKPHSGISNPSLKRFIPTNTSNTPILKSLIISILSSVSISE